MISHYEVSIAVPADAPRIAELSRDAIEEGLGWSWTPHRVARSVRDRTTNVVVARSGSSFAGFAIMKYGEDEAHLLLLAVHSAHRRRGVGTTMLAWLEATLRAAGIAMIRLEARARNTAALAFYRKHGFNQTGLLEGYYSDREDAVRLERDLRVGDDNT